MVCLAITGAMSSTPLAAMESLLEFFPLHIHIESVAKREMYRLSVGKLTTICCYDKGHSKIWTELMKHDPILSASSDFEGVNPFTEINFQVKFPRREEWTELTTLPATGDVVFYTDGSLMDGGQFLENYHTEYF